MIEPVVVWCPACDLQLRSEGRWVEIGPGKWKKDAKCVHCGDEYVIVVSRFAGKVVS